MDPVAITAGALSVGSHIVGLIKSLGEKLKASGKAEAMNDLLDMQVTMMELLAKYQESVSEVEALKVKNKELQDALDTHGKLECHHDCYWLRIDDTTLDGPYLAHAWDDERKVIRMVFRGQSQGCAIFTSFHGRTHYEVRVPHKFIIHRRVQSLRTHRAFEAMLNLRQTGVTRGQEAE